MPNPYLIIALLLALGGSFVGGYLKGGADTGARWEAATERLKAEASQTLAEETAKAAAKDAENAELANKLDVEHAKAVQDALATRDDFSRRLLVARRGARCSGPAAPPAADPGVGAGPAPERNDGSGGPDPGLILRDAALELQRYAVACHGWAVEVGR